MLRYIEWWVQNWPITKKGVLPVTALFFWKFCLSLRTSYKELIWCTNDLNAHIPTFCKRFIWRCFFAVSILKIFEKYLIWCSSLVKLQAVESVTYWNEHLHLFLQNDHNFTKTLLIIEQPQRLFLQLTSRLRNHCLVVFCKNSSSNELFQYSFSLVHPVILLKDGYRCFSTVSNGLLASYFVEHLFWIRVCVNKVLVL